MQIKKTTPDSVGDFLEKNNTLTDITGNFLLEDMLPLSVLAATVVRGYAHCCCINFLPDKDEIELVRQFLNGDSNSFRASLLILPDTTDINRAAEITNCLKKQTALLLDEPLLRHDATNSDIWLIVLQDTNIIPDSLNPDVFPRLYFKK